MSPRFLCSLGCAVLLAGCGRGSESTAKKSHAEEKDAERSGRVVEATWYNVPDHSLAKRRAGEAELTAASDHFKLGTLVRVTRVSNDRSVVVRITDTGVGGSKSRIDLCEEAARELGMVEKGVAKVRVRALPADSEASATVTPGSRLGEK
jgi:rare lipoprotein A (peptidoglycan hydrolase)